MYLRPPMNAKNECSRSILSKCKLEACLYRVGHEAEDSTNPQQHGEPGEHVLAELDPLGGGGRRGEGVSPMLGQPILGRLYRQTILDVGVEALGELVEGDLVHIDLQLLLQLI